MPVPRPVSDDAFRQPDRRPPLVPIAIPAPEPAPDPVASPPTAPTQLRAPVDEGINPAEWGLDLATGTGRSAPEFTPSQPPASGRRLFGRGKATAARLLVMALVVGAEGVAVTQLGGNAAPLDGTSAAAAFELTTDAADAQAENAADAAAQAVAVEEAENEAAELKEAVKDASPAKAKAAMAQYKQAKAAADRIKAAQERRERALRNAQRDPQSAAKLLVADRGWSSSQFACLDSLWTKESSWNYQATNASSGAYGIPQALPGSKMASAGSDWQTNPVTQIRWGLDYIAERYGTPCAAWSHSQSVNWY